MRRKGNPYEWLIVFSVGVAIMENSTEFPQKIKKRIAVGSRNSNSGYLSEENQNTNLQKIYVPPCLVQHNVQ